MFVFRVVKSEYGSNENVFLDLEIFIVSLGERLKIPEDIAENKCYPLFFFVEIAL